MLLLVGLVVLGVCVVAPAWLNSQQLAGQEQELTRDLERLRISNYHYREAIEAAGHDVAFNERLLIEQLNYHRPGEQALPVSSEQESAAAALGNNYILPPGNPAWLEAFAQRDTRNILLIMSTGLVLFALVYYRPTKRPAPLSDIPVHPASAKFISQPILDR